MSGAAGKSDRLSAFLRGPTFVVLTRNGGDPSPHGPFEAWAYRGPLDFTAAEPVTFGVAEGPVESLAALDRLLPSQPGGTCDPCGPESSHLTDRELATILGALRFHQDENLQGEGIADKAIEAIATDGGRLAPLSYEEVEALCEKLNTDLPLAIVKGKETIRPRCRTDDVVRQIHDLLYLDMDRGREFYDPDKQWDADLLDAIAEVVAEFIPRPGGIQACEESDNGSDHRPSQTAQVIVSVRGGISEPLLKPVGLVLTVFDYDIEGQPDLDQDPDGKPCRIHDWPASQGLVENPHWRIIATAPRDIEGPSTHSWKCPDCGKVVDVPYEDLAAVGNPICADCDVEMELV